MTTFYKFLQPVHDALWFILVFADIIGTILYMLLSIKAHSLKKHVVIPIGLILLTTFNLLCLSTFNIWQWDGEGSGSSVILDMLSLGIIALAALIAFDKYKNK